MTLFIAARNAQRLLASALMILALMVAAAAHELQASVGDIAFEDDRVRLDLRLNLEALAVGIGAEHDDTDEAPQRDEYDRLRALDPAALAAEIDDAPGLGLGGDTFEPITVEAFDADGQATATPLTFDASDLTIPEVGDTELARESMLTLKAALPPGTTAVRVTPTDRMGDLILRGTGENEAYGEFLNAGTASQGIEVTGATERGFMAVLAQYIGVGFEHILPLGLDHILFVVGLFLLDPRARPLLWQVSAFTLAHTITLALATFEVVTVPGSIVEPLIALSIAYVGFENVVTKKLSPWRPLLIFAFGLLHGLGFASVFEEYGIPEGQRVAALLGFNVGVEIGQIVVLAACFLAIGWFRNKDWYRPALTIPLSILVALIGLYWFVTRIGLVPEFLPLP